MLHFLKLNRLLPQQIANDSKPMLNLFDIEKLILETYI
jgi:hypothetical protein